MKALISEGRLAQHPFVAGATVDFLNQLEEFSSDVSFPRGRVIFHEGDYADRCFLILTGKVGLETTCNGGAKHLIETLGPGDILGWSWLFPPFAWHFSARALEATTAIALNGASLLVRAQEAPEFGFELMKRVSTQLIQRLQATRRRFAHKLKLRAGAN